MLKDNIKHFSKLAVVIFIYFLVSFLVIDPIQWKIFSGERTIIIEMSWAILDIICAIALFCIGYKNNKIGNYVVVMFFSFMCVCIALIKKTIFPVYGTFFGFSMLAGTITNMRKRGRVNVQKQARPYLTQYIER